MKKPWFGQTKLDQTPSILAFFVIYIKSYCCYSFCELFPIYELLTFYVNYPVFNIMLIWVYVYYLIKSISELNKTFKVSSRIFFFFAKKNERENGIM